LNLLATQVQPPSRAAKEGTRKHKILDEALKDNAQRHSAPEINRMLQWVTKLRREGYEVVSEMKIKIGQRLRLDTKYEDVCFGTADVLAWNEDNSHRIVADAKFGRYIVRAQDNRQLLLYACGDLGLDKASSRTNTVDLCIMQPENPDFFDVATYTFDEMREWQKKFAFWINLCAENIETLFDTKSIDSLNLVPGATQCQWCLNKAVCPQYSESEGLQAMKKKEDVASLANEFEVPATDEVVKPVLEKELKYNLPPEAGALFKGCNPDEAYARALSLSKEASVVINWFTEGLKSGVLKSEKYEVVDMNAGNRVWASTVNAEDVSFIMGIDVNELLVPATLKSPAAIEKDFGKDFLATLEKAELIERKTPSKTIKPKAASNG
jgi:hypothetical protein